MWVPHFETELELMLLHKERGDDVCVLRCVGNLATCSSNPDHLSVGCLKCISRCNQGLSKVGIDAKNVFSIKKMIQMPEVPTVFESLEALQAFTLWDIEFGLFVTSSLISELKDHRFDPKIHAERVYRTLTTSVHVYRSVYDLLTTIKPDVMYTFNGRFADLSPAIAACQKLGITFYTHERGSSHKSYSLFKNSLPHNLAAGKKEIETTWHNAPDSDREIIAQQWFTNRREGAEQAWYSFVEGQQRDLLPESFDINKINITIFNSCIEEYETFSDWKNTLYPDETQALHALFEAFAQVDDVHFYLRVHPNLKNKTCAQMKDLKILEAKNYQNVTIIWPDHVIDSYALLMKSNKILTFGSTVGVEATFWGIPSILAGRSLYEDLDVCHIPKTHDDLIAMMNNPHLKIKNKEGVCRYGFWAATRGISFKKFQSKGLFSGAFLGEELKPKFGFKDKLKLRFYSKLDNWKLKSQRRI